MSALENCYKCGRWGHWAAQCDRQPCPKCLVRLDRHTRAGLVECAWRGHACQNCANPPHPDGAPGRCARYTHPEDTDTARGLRAVTPWRRNSDPATWYTVPGFDEPRVALYVGPPALPPRDEFPGGLPTPREFPG